MVVVGVVDGAAVRIQLALQHHCAAAAVRRRKRRNTTTVLGLVAGRRLLARLGRTYNRSYTASSPRQETWMTSTRPGTRSSVSTRQPLFNETCVDLFSPQQIRHCNRLMAEGKEEDVQQRALWNQ